MLENFWEGLHEDVALELIPENLISGGRVERSLGRVEGEVLGRDQESQ